MVECGGAGARSHGLLYLFRGQVLCRAILGLLGWLAFRRLRRAVGFRLGRDVGACFSLVCASQFHLPFYLSRPLPNTFALAGAAVGYAAWFRRRSYEAVSFTPSSVIRGLQGKTNAGRSSRSFRSSAQASRFGSTWMTCVPKRGPAPQTRQASNG